MYFSISQIENLIISQIMFDVKIENVFYKKLFNFILKIINIYIYIYIFKKIIYLIFTNTT